MYFFMVIMLTFEMKWWRSISAKIDREGRSPLNVDILGPESCWIFFPFVYWGWVSRPSSSRSDIIWGWHLKKKNTRNWWQRETALEWLAKKIMQLGDLSYIKIWSCVKTKFNAKILNKTIYKQHLILIFAHNKTLTTLKLFISKQKNNWRCLPFS